MVPKRSREELSAGSLVSVFAISSGVGRQFGKGGLTGGTRAQSAPGRGSGKFFISESLA